MNTLYKTLIISTTVLIVGACSKDSRAPYVPAPEPTDNTAPVIADVAEQQISADGSSEGITLSLSDNSSAAEQLVLLVSSSDPSVITDQGLVISGDGAQRTLVITPVPDTIGSSNIMLSVTDAANNNATSMFAVNVIANSVSARSFVNDVLTVDENQDPLFVNGIELIQDIENDTEFDYLLED